MSDWQISDSLDSIIVEAEGFHGSKPRPIDPNSKEYARLLELKKLLEERKKREENERNKDAGDANGNEPPSK